MRCRNRSASEWVMRPGSRLSLKTPDSALVNPTLRSTWRKSITPPSLETSPPVKPASILRRSKLGKPSSPCVQSVISEVLSDEVHITFNLNRLPTGLRYFFAHRMKHPG